jgi:hypothetical protein
MKRAKTFYFLFLACCHEREVRLVVGTNGVGALMAGTDFALVTYLVIRGMLSYWFMVEFHG